MPRTLMPFNEKVTTIFTSDKFKVWGSDALKLTIEADDYAYEDIPYNISTRLTNVSDIDVYNVNLQLNEDPNYYYVLCDKEQSVAKLTPGQSIALEHQLWSMFDGPLENIETIFTNKQDPNNALKVEVIKRKAPLHVSTSVGLDSIDDSSTNYITVEALIDNKKPYTAENIIAELGWDSAGIELISGPVIQQIASLNSKSSTKVIWKLKANYREYVFTVKVKADNAREIESKTSYKTYKKVIYESSGNDYSSDNEDDEDYYDTFDDSYYDNIDNDLQLKFVRTALRLVLENAIYEKNPGLKQICHADKEFQKYLDGLAKGVLDGFVGTLKSEVTDIVDLFKLTIKASQDVQTAKLAAKVFVILYLTNPEFKEFVDDSVKEMASQAEVLWNNREVVFKAVKEKVIEVAESAAKAACENLIQTFESASGLQRDEIGFIGFSIGYSIGNVSGFVAETVLIALLTEGVGLLAKAGKLGKISKLVDMLIDASKVVDPSELLNLLNPKKAKKILFEGFENAADSFKTALYKLKNEREALFEVVEETKDLGSDIAYKLRNGTEIQIPKSQLTVEEIACSIDGCFTGDTLVLTKEGNRRIDEIKEGDFVYAKDVKTGQSAYKKVKYVYIKNSSKLIHLVAEGEEIRTTSTHLFFTDSGWWKAARNIQVGERILTSNGELVTVTATSVEMLEEPERIYNLNVEDYHTYFVGSQGLLVHNDCTEQMIGA